jgi:calcineurin-like phosphoesterase family protein
MRPTFFTADHHFGHENIIEYCQRPFTGVEDMEWRMVKAWNSVVPLNARVYYLGDLGWGSTTYFRRIMTRLNFEQMIIVPGNHDPSITKMERYTSRIVGMKGPISVPLKGKRYWLSHEPMDDGRPGMVNLHGHVHKHYAHAVGECGELWINVGVDVCNFRPLSLRQIEKARGTR